MEAGRIGNEDYDLVDIMVKGADPSFPDSELEELERKGCPTCGCCSGMFTANSMNCLSEALGMAPVGNGTVLSTHRKRYDLFMRGADLIVRNAKAYYFDGDDLVYIRYEGIQRKVFFKYNLMDEPDASLFKIPDDYLEITY